jgi:hypothetical protein
MKKSEIDSTSKIEAKSTPAQLVRKGLKKSDLLVASG